MKLPRAFLPVLATLFGLAVSPAFAQGSVFSQGGAFGAWVGIVVAGDNEASSGEPAEVFDNARRDIADQLVNIGFSSANVREFSTQPGRYVEASLRSDFDVIAETFDELTRFARGGCFLYFTSHGAPQGIVLNGYLLSPELLDSFLDDACPDRVTVVIISACYSGVFIPALAASNRMILTAARPDRASFGCGESFTYTYFDQCVLESLPLSPTFPALGANAQACVAAREEAEGVAPPSEPQMFVGARAAPLLELYTLPTSVSALAPPAPEPEPQQQ